MHQDTTLEGPHRGFSLVAHKKDDVGGRPIARIGLIALIFVAIGGVLIYKGALLGSMSRIQIGIVIFVFTLAVLFGWFAIAFGQLKRLQARQFLAIDEASQELVLAHLVRDRETRRPLAEHRVAFADIVEVERIENPPQSWIRFRRASDDFQVQGPFDDIEPVLNAIGAPIAIAADGASPA